MVANTTGTTSALTYFAVVQMSTLTNYETFFNTEGAWSSGGVGGLLYVNNGVQYAFYNTGSVGNPTLTMQTGCTYVMSAVDTGTTAAVYINGHQVASVNSMNATARNLRRSASEVVGRYKSHAERLLLRVPAVHQRARRQHSARGRVPPRARKWGADYMYQARFGNASLWAAQFAPGATFPGMQVPHSARRARGPSSAGARSRRARTTGTSCGHPS